MTEIRACEPRDHEAVDAVLRAAFGEEEGDTIVPLVADLRRRRTRAASWSPRTRARWSGHVLLSRSWVDARRALVEVLVLSPLSVAPSHQGRGVGAALLEAAEAEARRLRAPVLFLEGDPGYYSQHGFEPGADAGFERPSVRIPGAGVPGRSSSTTTRTGCPGGWSTASRSGPTTASGCATRPSPSSNRCSTSIGGCRRTSPRPAGPVRSARPTRPTGSAPPATGCSTSARRSTAATRRSAATSWCWRGSRCCTSRPARPRPSAG